MRRAHLGIILLCLVLAVLVLPPLTKAATYAVNQEWAVTGTTTGVPGAQVADGAFETLTEGDVAPDPTNFPSTQTITTGSQVSGTFPSGIQTSDDTWIYYREAATGATTTSSLNPGTVGAACMFTLGGNGRLSDNVYATSGSGDNCFYNSFGFSLGAAAAVTKVEVGYEAFTSGDDKYTVSASWDSGTTWCPGILTATLPAADPNTYTFLDFTSCRSWTPTEVNNVATQFTHVKVASGNTNSLDANIVRVTYIPANNFQFSLQYSWTGVPLGTNQRLTVEGHVAGENFNVQVLTPPATWNTRVTLNAGTDQSLTYDLLAAEYNGGSPALRFVDASGADASQSDLYLDRVSILTTIVDYRLDVRQNITGILGVSPVLVVKGSIPSGGDNYNVYAWNFTAGVWDLRLAAAFTTTNAYQNLSLPPQDISGGTVRLRYVDTITPDTLRDFLSLDLVAISTTPGNAPPGLSNDGVTSVVGNITTSFTFFVRYTDVDNDAPLYVRLRFNNVTYDMVANNSADTIYSDGKDYHYTMVIGTRGTFLYNFTTRAAAGDASTVDSPTRQVQVLNRAPTILNPISLDGVHMGRWYIRDFNATDPDGDATTWSAVTNASWLALGAANGTVWGRAPTLAAIYYVNVTVADAFGGRESVNYTLSVGNRPPVITTPSSTVTAFRGPFSTTVAATDPDGDPLTWSMASNASFATLNSATGTISGTGTPPPGSFFFQATVTDGLGGSDTVNFTIAFVNRAPEISGAPTLGTTAGDSYGVSFAATDPDGDPVSWSLATNASWLVLDGKGYLSGTAVPGTYYINVTVRDAYGASSSRNYTLVVAAIGAAPFGGWLYLGLLLGGVGAAVGTGVFLFLKRRARGDVILKAIAFTDQGVKVQELVSEKEEPRLGLPELLKLLPGGKPGGEHWLRSGRYCVAVVREGQLNLAVVTRYDDEEKVKQEARGLLAEMGQDEEVKAALRAPSGPLARSAATPTPRQPMSASEVRASHAYLVEEERPVESLGTLEALVRQGKQALVITRANPRMFRQNYDLRDSKVYWLVDRNEPERGELMPPSLEKIAFLIQEFCHDNPGSVIFIEGLEFLVDNNNFGAVLKLMRRLVDMVSQGDHILLVSLSPHILQERERRSLEKEMEVLGTEASARQ